MKQSTRNHSTKSNMPQRTTGCKLAIGNAYRCDSNLVQLSSGLGKNRLQETKHRCYTNEEQARGQIQWTHRWNFSSRYYSKEQKTKLLTKDTVSWRWHTQAYLVVLTSLHPFCCHHTALEVAGSAYRETHLCTMTKILKPVYQLKRSHQLNPQTLFNSIFSFSPTLSPFFQGNVDSIQHWLPRASSMKPRKPGPLKLKKHPAITHTNNIWHFTAEMALKLNQQTHTHLLRLLEVQSLSFSTITEHVC